MNRHVDKEINYLEDMVALGYDIGLSESDQILVLTD
jgi:hypothetical protein